MSLPPAFVFSNDICRDITSQILNTTRALVMILDRNGRILQINRQSEELGGYPLADIKGALVWDVYYPDPLERDAVQDKLTQVCAGHFPITSETTWVTRSGEKRIISWTDTAVLDQNGTPLYMIGTGIDLTEQRSLEKQLQTFSRTEPQDSPRRSDEDLRQDREYLESLLNYASAPIVVWDNEFRITRFNRAFERMTGFRAQNVIGHPLELLFPEENRKEAMRHILRTLKGDRWEALEIPIMGHLGVVRTVLWNSAPVMDKNGNQVAVIAQGQDITERKQIEKELAESQSMLRLVLDTIPQRVFWKNRKLIYMGCNQPFALDAGLKEPSRVVGKEDSHMAWKSQADQLREIDRQIIETGIGRFGIEERRERENGEWFWVRASKVPLTNPSGNVIGILGTYEDITARKKTEEELLVKTGELERSNKELEQFAYIASHDLQEPLRMVVSYLQLIQRRYQGKLDQEADEFIHYAVDGAMRMQLLINDLLTYSRLGTRAKPFARIPVGDVLKQVLQNLEFSIQESGARITCDPLPEVMGDEVQLSQLLQNLLGNAIKFRRKDVPLKIHIELRRMSGEWVFGIQDNGIGIEPKYFDRIFAIFQRLHAREEYPGTGIGLAVCKKIVERHGGRIWVQSRPGEGSTFLFTIPVIS